MSMHDQHVTISLPADTAFVALARAAAASLAVELDFSVDDIDDLRLAVDEMVTLLVEAKPGDGRIDVRLSVDAQQMLAVEGTIADRADNEEADPLTVQILEALTESLTIEPTRVTFGVRGARE